MDGEVIVRFSEANFHTASLVARTLYLHPWERVVVCKPALGGHFPRG